MGWRAGLLWAWMLLPCGAQSHPSYQDAAQPARADPAKACPNNRQLQAVHSQYHGADHCVCPDSLVCTGPMCSTGQAVNGDVYHKRVHGYHVDCLACRCTERVAYSDIQGFRDSQELWIVGTHHKTGSFLSAHLWGGFHQLVHPSLQVHLFQYWSPDQAHWQRLKPEIDVVVAFHAEDIGPPISNWTARPYRFVHIVRDPVDIVVSAYLYETQRAKQRDPYQRRIRNLTRDEGLLAMSNYMQQELAAMEAQFQRSALDHHAINMKLEDFAFNFSDTVERMLVFLGVPPQHLAKFMQTAAREDLSRTSVLQGSEHVTAGKYNKGPLKELVFADPRYTQAFRRMKKTMGYTCCP